jgi:GNAT superfamily N-acetyltransferase
MEIIVKDLVNLTEKQRNAVEKLVISNDVLLEKLHNRAIVNGGYLTFLIFKNNQYIAWGILVVNPRDDWQIDPGYFMLYVKPDCRRKGYGTLLFRKAQEVAKKKRLKIKICPYDKRSIEFFKSVGMKNRNVAEGYDYLETIPKNT